jgi:hypothetical protein
VPGLQIADAQLLLGALAGLREPAPRLALESIALLAERVRQTAVATRARRPVRQERSSPPLRGVVSSYFELLSESDKISAVRNATSGADMRSSRRTALIAGLWFAGTFVFSIPVLFFYDPVLNDAEYILGAGADTRTELGAFLEILTAICNIATAVVLFPILRRVTEAVALGYVALRIVESTIIVIGLISLMSVVTLREAFAGAGGDSGALDMAVLCGLREWNLAGLPAV